MAGKVKLKGRWVGFKKAMDPRRLTPELQRSMKLATMRNGKYAERAVRKLLQEGIRPPNADLTIAIKGSAKPLVDTGFGIFQAITSVVVSDTEVFVGILRKDSSYDIGVALHDGVTIKVTDKMRWMFWALWQASMGKRDPNTLTGRAAELWSRRPGIWLPLRDSTVAIKIPPRPFLEAAFQDPELKRLVTKSWEKAIQSAIVRSARK